MTRTICGLTVGDKISAPMPFDGTAEIIGFRYHTSRNTGRTYMVADYLLLGDGKFSKELATSFDAVEKVIPLKIVS